MLSQQQLEHNRGLCASHGDGCSTSCQSPQWILTGEGFVCHVQLREQRETIEGLVDDVVECYHNGFAKAIHNYSQILQLFSDSKAQVLYNMLG